MNFFFTYTENELFDIRYYIKKNNNNIEPSRFITKKRKSACYLRIELVLSSHNLMKYRFLGHHILYFSLHQ